MKQLSPGKVNNDDGEGAVAGADQFGFGRFERWEISAFAAQIVLHLVVITCEIEE
jgi:hypothetical protein